VSDQLKRISDCDIGTDTDIQEFVNLYGCTIGDECLVGPFVEIQRNAELGDRVRVQSHSFVCSQTTIGDDVFVGHGVMFINDRYPPRFDPEAWEPVDVEDGVAIGSNATILPVRIGHDAVVGAGAVVTEDVEPGAVVAGNPAEVIGWVDETEGI
jgi:acetyltransferase-like isoleucine patch superfamily enzyme